MSRSFKHKSIFSHTRKQESQVNNVATAANLEGDYWMIGMEEGGGDNIAEIEKRITCGSGVPRGCRHWPN